MNNYIHLGITANNDNELIAYKKDGKFFLKLYEEKEISRGFFEAIKLEFDENARTDLDTIKQD